MLRINLLVAVAVAAGVVGCAQCDTCDDFPAPCTGPNCGQPYSVPTAMTDPAMSQGGPVMGTMTPVAPASDAAGPAPATPAPATQPRPPRTPPPPVPAARPRRWTRSRSRSNLFRTDPPNSVGGSSPPPGQFPFPNPP